MALIGAVDRLGHRFVGNLGDVGMAVAALNIAVNAVIVNAFIDIIIPALAVFVDSAGQTIFVAHEAVVFIGSVCLGAVKEGQEYS